MRVVFVFRLLGSIAVQGKAISRTETNANVCRDFAYDFDPSFPVAELRYK